jgi:hypothetical protein
MRNDWRREHELQGSPVAFSSKRFAEGSRAAMLKAVSRPVPPFRRLATGDFTKSVAAFDGESEPGRRLKRLPLVADAGVGRDCCRIHLIGIDDIPRIHGVQFVAVGAENDPILFSGADRDAGAVGLYHQRAAGTEARQARSIPRLQCLAGHAVVVGVEAEDNAIGFSLRIADGHFDSGHGVIGGGREGSRHPLLALRRTHDVVA